MASQKRQLIKSDRRMFASSDDNVVMKQVLATHAPDGRDIDVRPILGIVEDILKRAKVTNVATQAAQLDVVEDNVELTGMLEALAYIIHKIGCEISCKCSGGGDAHATAMTLLNTLNSYTWDTKAVLAVAAFAVSYGEFWLTAQLQTVNPLAKSVALLKQMPDLLEHSHALKPRTDALNALIRAILDVTKCIVELKELPSEYISPETPAMTLAMDHIPLATYWIIRSVVACASQIIGLIGMGHEFMTSTTEAWELSSLAHKISNIHGHLMKQLELCHQHIDEKKHIEAYQTMLRLFEITHVDNLRILRTLFHSKDDLPLVDGSTKKRVSVDVLRRKIVILLISDLDLSHEELMVLTQIYNDTHHGKIERHHEVVWVPVVDKLFPWTESKEDLFVHLASSMPWYSVQHPSLLDRAVVKYIREVWYFEKKPLLVVLDPQGRVTCPNALHMMYIWGSLAFPFTSSREEDLWKEEAWRLELLVDDIDPMILQWAREDKFICLYGGEDMDWIRRFTTVMKQVAQEAQIPLEMIYVGKSNPKDRVKKNITSITDEGLSVCWHDPNMIWFFWVRLESMWHSKMQRGKTIETDPIMQEVMTMLTFDGSDEGWAVISKGSMEMVRSHGKKLVECLMNFDDWKDSVSHEGFLPALENALQPYQTQEHCARLILPGASGKIQENVICAECKRPMEMFFLYRCCTD